MNISRKLISIITLTAVLITLFVPVSSSASGENFMQVYILNEDFDGTNPNWNGTYHADEGYLGLHANSYGTWAGSSCSRNWTVDKAEKGEIYFEFDYMLNSGTNLKADNAAKIGMRDYKYGDTAIDFFSITPAGLVRKMTYGTDDQYFTYYTVTKDEWHKFKIFLNTDTGYFEVYAAKKGDEFTDEPLFTSGGRYDTNNPAADGVRGVTFVGFYSKNAERELDVAYVDNVKVYRLAPMPEIVGASDAFGNEGELDVRSRFVKVKFDGDTSAVSPEDVSFTADGIITGASKVEVDSTDSGALKVYPESRLMPLSDYEFSIHAGADFGGSVLSSPMTFNFTTKDYIELNREECYEDYLFNSTFDTSDSAWNAEGFAELDGNGVQSLWANEKNNWNGSYIAKHWTGNSVFKGELYCEFDYMLAPDTNLNPSDNMKISMRDDKYANGAVPFFIITPAGYVRKGFGTDANANIYTLTKGEWYSFRIFLNTESGDYEVYVCEQGEEYPEEATISSNGRFDTSNSARNGVRGLCIDYFFTQNPEREQEVAYLDNAKAYVLKALPKIESLTDASGNSQVEFDTGYVTLKLDSSASKLKAEDFEFEANGIITGASKVEIDSDDETVINVYPAQKLISALDYELRIKTGATVGSLVLPKEVKCQFATTADVIDITDTSFEYNGKITFSGELINNSGKSLNAVVVMYTSKDGVFTGLSFKEYTIAPGKTATVELEASDTDETQDAHVIVIDSWQTRKPVFDKRFEF